MPVLNTAGQSLCGAGAGFSIDGAPIAALVGVAGDTARWMTATVIVFQNNSAGSVISSYDTISTVLTTVDANGVTRMGAGAGHWAAFLAGPPVGVRSSIPGWVTLPAAGTVDLDENGVVALMSSYGTGNGVALYNVVGAQQFADPNVFLTPYNWPILCRSGLVMYSTAAGWLLRAAPSGTLIPSLARNSLNWTVPVKLASGDIWIVERSDRITIRQKDANVGFLLAPVGTLTFQPDAREVSPGVVRICWTTDAGETATNLQVIDLTLATGANRTAVVSGGALVYTTQSPLTPINLATGTPTLQKWVGWYYSSGRYGDFRPKQNCTVLALKDYADGSGNLPAGAQTMMLNAAIAAGAIFCSGRQEDIDVMRPRWDLVAGLVTGEGTAQNITLEAAQFRDNVTTNGLPMKPIIATLTPGQLTAGWTPPGQVDAYAPEVYFAAPAGSYAAQYSATQSLINSYIAAAAGVPLYLIAQAYDRNNNPAWVAAVDQIGAIIDACGDALKADQ